MKILLAIDVPVCAANAELAVPAIPAKGQGPVPLSPPKNEILANISKRKISFKN